MMLQSAAYEVRISALRSDLCDSDLVMFFFKQKTAYEMRISDWSSDVCSSYLLPIITGGISGIGAQQHPLVRIENAPGIPKGAAVARGAPLGFVHGSLPGNVPTHSGATSAKPPSRRHI